MALNKEVGYYRFPPGTDLTIIEVGGVEPMHKPRRHLYTRGRDAKRLHRPKHYQPIR
jgi:hypothetical protein